jgi:hypothetical protein
MTRTRFRLASALESNSLLVDIITRALEKGHDHHARELCKGLPEVAPPTAEPMSPGMALGIESALASYLDPAEKEAPRAFASWAVENLRSGEWVRVSVVQRGAALSTWATRSEAEATLRRLGLARARVVLVR